MQWIIRGFLLFVLLGFFLQCRDNSDRIEQTRGELRATWDTFIKNWEAEDVASCVKIFKKDGVSVPPKRAPLKGRSAIASLYHRLFEENLSSRYEHEIISVYRANDQAVERGKFTVYWIAKDSTAWSYEGRSLTHWIRTKDGPWKIQQFFFNNPEDPGTR